MTLEMTELALEIRDAHEDDYTQLANLIHFEKHVHRHLDWRPPLDWLGFDPYLIAEHKGRMVGALACPPDPPGVAWIRLFAATSHTDPNKLWKMMWPKVYRKLEGLPITSVAAIPLHDWFRELLKKQGFKHVHDVVVLMWENSHEIEVPNIPDVTLRAMELGDLEEIQRVDEAAFGPIWRNSLDTLQLAFEQTAVATVAEMDNQIIGYQISTPSPFGVHLARLAVHPNAQRGGIGFALVRELQSHYSDPPLRSITVNTQSDNHRSLGLYQKAGFRPTKETYPVFQYQLTL